MAGLLISGYGKSYGYVFTEVGCRTVSDLDRLDATQLQALQLLIKASSMEKSARRYIARLFGRILMTS